MEKHKKKIILAITGTSGAGKTTLAQAIAQGCFGPSVIIPQVTTREKRPDDPENYFKYYKKEQFGEEDFFCKSESYGICQGDIADFLRVDNAPLGVCIVGGQEASDLMTSFSGGPNNGFSLKHILITYHDTIEKELACLPSELGNFFEGEKLAQRISAFETICKTHFFNKNFLSNIDIHLNRQQGLEEWCQTITKELLPDQYNKAATLACFMDNYQDVLSKAAINRAPLQTAIPSV